MGVNITIPVLYLAVILNILLGIIILSRGLNKLTNILFALVAFFVSFWSVAIVGFYDTNFPLHLPWVKITHFSALSIMIVFLYFSANFPIRIMSNKIFYFSTILIYILLSYYVIFTDKIIGKTINIVYEINQGYIIYQITLLIGFLLGFYFLYNQFLKSKKEFKNQIISIIIGSVTSTTLALITNLILPYFGIFQYTWLGPIFTIILVITIFIAILKYRLFDIKVILTELFVIILITVLIIQLISSTTLPSIILNGFVLLTVSVFSYFLINSVYKEVDQREKLEILSKELRQKNKQLRKFDKLKTEFLSIASHQLRTPLSGIKGYMSMILDGDFGKFTDEQMDVLKRVKTEVDRLIRMVQVFLNVSRIESGRLFINNSPFNLCELINDVVEELAPTAQNKNIKIILNKPKEDIIVDADSDKIKDVVVNIIDNAIKYTPEGKIEITVKKTNSHARVQVRDTGIGIDKEEIDELFSKFKRAKGVSEISPSGSGLGLFIAKKIIEAHKGKIWVESEGVGRGSVFTFILPIKFIGRHRNQN